MRKKYLTLLFVALSSFAEPLSAQISQEDYCLAIDVLKGKETTYEKKWAVGMLEESLNLKRDAFTLNVLGIVYLNGLGVEPDTTKAISLMEESGDGGCNLAFHNLGMYYKYLRNEKQNFFKAHDAFMKGASAGSPLCCYDAGFMFYKGLGCEQNYEKAVELLQKSAEYDHAPALFLLGLCYRNGYGVECDERAANFFLERAAMYNNRDAMEELNKNLAENDSRKNFIEINKSMEIPDSMPNINPYIPNNTSIFTNAYKGLLITYDWSGKNIISERPIAVNMIENNNKISGLWTFGNDSVLFNARISKENELLFDSTEVVLYDRYSTSKKQNYRVEKAEINCTECFISGRLRLYSLKEQEPERPMYLCLQKEDTFISSTSNEGKIFAYPTPFQTQLTIKFELEKPCSNTKVGIYTNTGVSKQQFNLGSLDAGEHKISISPNVNNGVYILRIVADNLIYQTIIIRKQ